MHLLERMKIALVEREIFVQKNLADKITIIAADDIRIVRAHDQRDNRQCCTSGLAMH